MEKTEEKKIEEKNNELQTVAAAVTPLVMKAIEAQKPQVKQGIFEDGTTSERKELAEKKQIAVEYLKAMENGNRAQTKALSAGSSTNGAELVPTYVSEQVITLAQNYGLVRKYAKKWPMNGINDNIPTFTTATAYRAGSDTSALRASAPATGTVNLRAKTLAVVIPISRVLLQNATPILIDTLVDIAGKAIAKYEDEWAFLGKASGEGIFQNTSVPVVTMATGAANMLYTGATAENLLDVIDKVDENFLGPSMRWIMSLSVLNNFRRIRSVVGSDKQGFLLENLGGNLPATLWDIPFDHTAVMPKNSDSSQTSQKFLALCDYSNLVHGDAMEYAMEMSDQATIVDTDNSTPINLWQQNMVALKIWGLIDIQLANAAYAFATLKTSAS